MSSFSRSAWFKGEDEDSEDDEIQDEQVKDRPDAIMYLVDVSPSMHKATPVDDPDEDEDGDGDGPRRSASNISTALRSALELMKIRIISGNSRDVIGIALYNVEQARSVQGELPKDGIHVLLEPSTIRAANIKAVGELVEEAETSPKSFQLKYTPLDTEVKQTTLIEAMRFSESLLKQRSSNLSNRSLYLVTDTDDPFQGNKQQQSVALVFANDAHESGFKIKTFFMPEEKDQFDLSKFWNRFRYDPSIDAEMDNAAMVFAGPKRFEKFLELSDESGKSKRALFSIPFYLYENIAMSVTGYGPVGEQKKRPPVNIERAEDIREVYPKTVYTESATGENLDPKRDIIKYASIGTRDAHEQRVFFEPSEIEKIKNLGMRPSLKLLGFQPRSTIKEQHTYKHSYLIYPNETTYTNSVRAFSALLESMLKKEVVGVGVLIARANSSPQMVYMLPQAEVRDEESDVQNEPPCIWLIQVPFADDMRDPTVTACLSAKPPESDAVPLIQHMRSLIKKLRVQYRPYLYENPTLQYHYKTLEALALQLDAPEAKDGTFPDVAAISERAGPVIGKLHEALEAHPNLSKLRWSGTGASHGGADDQDEDGSRKKVKTSKERAAQDISVLEKSLTKAFEEEKSGKVTNDTLKDYLKQKGHTKLNKKKAELLEMVRDQLTADGYLAG